MPFAARINDMHTCPMVNGVVPHVGGPIVPPGAINVLIEGFPAAKVGDMAICTGPPDSLLIGSTSVLINGVPAVRVGDTTVHGGIIVTGATSVIIGG